MRVWLVASSYPNFIKSIDGRAHANDIVLQFDPQTSSVVLIGGYSKNKLKLPSRISPSISLVRLSEKFRADRSLVEAARSGVSHFLTDNEWFVLRSELLDDRDGLNDIIRSLEARQAQNEEIVAVPALLYDLVRTALEMFQPRSLFEKQFQQNKKEFADLQKYGKSEVDNYVTQLFYTLNNTEGFRNYGYSSDSEMKDVLQDKFPEYRLEEEDIIREDLGAGIRGFGADKSYLTPEYQRHFSRLTDNSGRELYLILAHRRGLRNSDVSGSDLIYVSRIHQSFILIQYKLYEPDSTLELNPSQHNMLLSACQIQGCSNCDQHGNYLHSNHIRLLDCPVYYKLVNHVPKITGAGSFIAGEYIQACLINQLANEPRSVRLTKKNIGRSLKHPTFVELVRTGQIGSRASEYDKVLEHVNSQMKAKNILLIALETHDSTIRSPMRS